MEWIAENWFWILIGVLFIVMHLFGHGSHGGHGGHYGHGGQEYQADKKQQHKRSDAGSGHHHH